MRLFHKTAISLKALRQLGLEQVGLYAGYQFALRSGALRRKTPAGWPAPLEGVRLQPILDLPGPEALQAMLGPAGRDCLLNEADEIVAGQVRLFGTPPATLQLEPPGELCHWTDAGETAPGGQDIKWIWEPGRFGWAYILARAYRLSGDERYPAAFWEYAETFFQANPPNCGPHWASAQEVALRLLALAFAGQVFGASPHSSPERQSWLAQAVAAHAGRIPPTLGYARAQNNNHLLSEAAALYTAAWLLPDHPRAEEWRALGWRWFNHGVQAQIDPDGAYAQHSANYQRLMLHLAVWFAGLAERNGQPLPETSRLRLAAATRWLLALVDPAEGRVPNLGPNDGALILPLSASPFYDYRPALQAAAAAFLGERPFLAGPWDEPLVWLPGHAALEPPRPQRPAQARAVQVDLQSTPHILKSPDSGAWGYLRVGRFTSRPGHADQLHLDLWWRGWNVAQDAGTYLYNAPPPWENALMSAAVHNTVTVNGQDQMTRAGRFLYLDWAQGRVLAGDRLPDGGFRRLTAEHDGYRRLGIVHRRTVAATGRGWRVEDELLAGRTPPCSAVLHWLLPDWPWELDVDRLRLLSPAGWIELQWSASARAQPAAPALQLVRAGEKLAGEGPVEPVRGWTAPTYGVKVPALALRLDLTGDLPLAFSTEWIFPV
jgi:hypothetical protein